jgi:hypothetical protein
MKGRINDGCMKVRAVVSDTFRIELKPNFYILLIIFSILKAKLKDLAKV